MDSAISSAKIVEALEFAAEAHNGQLRKSARAIPYIAHPAAVGSMLMHYGYSEDAVLAGYLHDVVEDTPHTLEDIASRFGQHVADLVSWVTEPAGMPRLEQKKIYLSRLSEAPTDAVAISCADLLCNRNSQLQVLKSGENPLRAMWRDWSESKLKEYAAEVVARDEKRLSIIREKLGDHPLVTETERVITEVHTSLKNTY